MDRKRRTISSGTVCGVLHQVRFDRISGQDVSLTTPSVQHYNRIHKEQKFNGGGLEINREPGSSGKPSLSAADSQSHYNQPDEVKNDGGDLFKCGQCKQIFTQRSLLNNHLCPHMPSKPYRCGHCPESFSHPKELRTHAVLHISEKPFKCGYCLRSFAGATTLDNHVRTHTGEKPFLCEKCGKMFTQASQLSRHQRICQQHGD